MQPGAGQPLSLRPSRQPTTGPPGLPLKWTQTFRGLRGLALLRGIKAGHGVGASPGLSRTWRLLNCIKDRENPRSEPSLLFS